MNWIYVWPPSVAKIQAISCVASTIQTQTNDDKVYYSLYLGYFGIHSAIPLCTLFKFCIQKTCDFKKQKHHQRGQYSNDASAFSSPFTFCIVNLFTHPCTYYYHGFCSKNPLYLKCWWWWWWRLPSIQQGNLFNKTLQTFSLSLRGCLRSRFFSTQ